jgi:hypothetical protein
MKQWTGQPQSDWEKMGTPRASGDAQAANCPACGARIKAGASPRNKRVQCPKCREIVVLETPAAKVSPAVTSAPGSNDTVAQQQSRIEALEARVAMLEKAVADATRAGAEKSETSILRWLPSQPAPEFSPEQADALRHNLSIMPAHRITIQFPSGNAPARERAEWFKGVFERARWSVRGPEIAAAVSTNAQRELSLATCLPVSAEVAATYLALRAAGFQPISEFDPQLNEAEERLIVA